MTNIIVTTKQTRIENLDSKLAIELSRELSFRDKNYWFIQQKTGWDGYVKFFTRPGNTFKTGLLPLVLKILDDHNTKYQILDKRENYFSLEQMDTNKVSKKELREYQIDTINRVASNTTGGVPFLRGVVNIATNGGKTVVAEAVIQQILSKLDDNHKLLFVTHSKEIAYQTKSSIEEDLKIDVGFIGDGKWNEAPVSVALVPTLYKNIKKPKFKALVNDTVGFIADEVHHAKSSSWYSVLDRFIKADLRLGLTGTIGNNAINEHKLYAVTGPIIIKISNEYLIEHGFSARPVCYYIEITNPDDIEDLDYQEAYTEGIVLNSYRNDTVTKIVQRELEKKSNILIFVERLEHGEIIENLLKETNINSVEFTNGQKSTEFRNKVLKDIKSGTLRVLISTSVLDEGIDVDNINSVIYARGMEAPRKILQGIGRGLRKKKDNSGLTFYDFLDYTNDYLIKHTKNRFLTIKEEGFEIKKLDMEKEE